MATAELDGGRRLSVVAVTAAEVREEAWYRLGSRLEACHIFSCPKLTRSGSHPHIARSRSDGHRSSTPTLTIHLKIDDTPHTQGSKISCLDGYNAHRCDAVPLTSLRA